MHLVAGLADDGAILAELINIACGDKRNFTPVTEQTLQALWSRNPTYANVGLLLVKDDNGALLGATHALYDSDAQIGYLPFLLSRPGHEDRVWPFLLSASEQYLKKASRLTIGSPYAPLYCALEGRFQPLWGTTEIMEPAETDYSLIAFLRERGFRLQQTYLTMTRANKGDVTKGEENKRDGSFCSAEQKEPSLLFSLFSLGRLQAAECWENNYLWYGQTAAEEFGLYNPALNVLLVRDDYRVIGHITWYPMRQANKAAICDLAVAKRHRGRGIGAYLLYSVLTRLYELGFSEVELCMTPTRSKAAYRLYLRAGFGPAATWLEMSKPLH